MYMHISRRASYQGADFPPTVCMYVCMLRFGGTSTRACTRTQARGATPELRRVADTTPHGLSAGRHSTQTTIGSPSLCGRPKGERGGRGGGTG